MTVQEMYEQIIGLLPANERLRLAMLILNDIPPQLVLHQSDVWNPKDEQDFSRATWALIERRIEEAERA